MYELRQPVDQVGFLLRFSVLIVTISDRKSAPSSFSPYAAVAPSSQRVSSVRVGGLASIVFVIVQIMASQDLAFISAMCFRLSCFICSAYWVKKFSMLSSPWSSVIFRAELRGKPSNFKDVRPFVLI